MSRSDPFQSFVKLHRLVHALPDQSLEAAAALLRRAQDPVVAELDASPYDDEEFTSDDEDAVREGLREPGVAWASPDDAQI